MAALSSAVQKSLPVRSIIFNNIFHKIFNKMTLFPDVLISSFLIGLGLIIAIGAQNIFIIKIGLQKKNVFLAATTAATCDTLLIALGTVFMSSLVQLVPMALSIAKWAGIAFLLFYSFSSLFNALRTHPKGWSVHEGHADSVSKLSKGVLIPTLAFSLLNPHVYLDTFLILGNLGSRLSPAAQLSFIIGAGSASYFWFYLTGFASKLSSRLFQKEITVRIFDFFVALAMLLIAYGIYNVQPPQ
ncbi:LysE/ArgO family amino acid transporter [Xenorhabdus anantnagensis]|uniref:LysE family transporter n=1 Tax=Xenorhabdus anantnagensis TaxID=3025875 RepID=A0ABT5LRM7_9GAMM|nr:LysE family transporter [Xenorhabdus anantnagensis]MDC9597056.1 LysE family transporter [Xenorhabdus anantnagensis]